MDEEKVVLVDERGKPTGKTLPKLAAHHADTLLHLAFSCYVFNNKGEFLVTQRAKSKRVWPGVWTNSVCGHPAPDEDIVDAIKRRLKYELGMEASEFEIILPNYRYRTPPFNGIIENEFCPIYAARAVGAVHPNPEEVADYKWVKWENFIEEAKNDTTDVYSWWCKDQIRFIENDARIQKYTKS